MNHVPGLPVGVFDDMAELRSLYLYGNQLDHLSADLFAGLQLEHLFLFCEHGNEGVGSEKSCGDWDNPKITCAPLNAAQWAAGFSLYYGPSSRCCVQYGDGYQSNGTACVCSPVHACAASRLVILAISCAHPFP